MSAEKPRILGILRWQDRAPTAFALFALLLSGCGGGSAPVSPPAPETEGTQRPVATVASNAGPPGKALGLDSTFWQTWGDGQAELSSYTLRYPRYGSLRSGTAVAIFVTENLSLASRVKTDMAPAPGNDAFPVMKLNLVEDFQTGIYDYNVMTSTFVALDAIDGRAAGQPAKVSFSSQEWCGHVYQQLLFGQHAIDSTMHSYFEGEADQQKQLPSPRNGFSEDVLMHWARGMAQPLLNPGETKSVSLLPSLKSSRFRHRPLGWTEARLSRGAEAQTLTVSAGTFEVEVFEAAIQGGPTRTYFVERAAPHRIVKWISDDGESAEMLRSVRGKYWQMNDVASEAKLSGLALPRPSQAP
ncbi:MAG: hypothetical protein U5J83_19070 [Bryobacterales bacterium]|nr:hypothetical protein [Bryobacterales bacterium]